VDQPVSQSGRVRFGVLGCSEIAWRRTLPAVASCPSTVVQAVASRDPAKARRFADRFDCAVAGYDELLERDDVDAVYLPLPASLHAPWGRRVLQAGKHLLVEKPAATCAADFSDLVRLAGEQGVVVRENFTFLQHSQHARVRQLVSSGRLGALRSLSAAFCFPPLPDGDIRYDAALGGGALFDAGVYPIRLAQLLLGDDLRVVGSTLRHDPDRDVDVAGQALLISADGVFASLQFGFEHTYGSQYSLWGSAARLHVDRAFTPPPSWQPVLRLDEQDHSERLLLPPDDQFARTVESFADAVRAGRAATDPDEAQACRHTMRTLDIVDEIRQRAVRVVTSQR
jgi:dTDP-3,4-didehydro-2,6-dideoxy-alpha-D-glucose 3-reductase